jgi:hypothetical protein
METGVKASHLTLVRSSNVFLSFCAVFACSESPAATVPINSKRFVASRQSNSKRIVFPSLFHVSSHWPRPAAAEFAAAAAAHIRRWLSCASQAASGKAAAAAACGAVAVIATH